MPVLQLSLQAQDAQYEHPEQPVQGVGDAHGVDDAGEPVDENSDVGIIMDCLAEKPERFGELVERYAGYVASFAFSKVRNRSDAEEIAQETMVRAFENLAKLRVPRRFSSWLLGIADHVAMDHLDKRGRSVSLDAVGEGSGGSGRFLPQGGEPGPEQAAGDAEDRRALLDGIAGLADRYRTVLVLKHQRGLSCEEIAKALGLATSTVTSRLSRAYSMLRSNLKGLGPDSVQ